MTKTTTLLAAFGLSLAQTLIANPGPPALPEPSALPEFFLCLAVIGAGYWIWRRTRKLVR